MSGNTGYLAADSMPISSSIGAGAFSKKDNSSASAYAGDWGNHTTTIDFGSTALSPKQVLIWGGVLFLGWFFWRKIKGLKK